MHQSASANSFWPAVRAIRPRGMRSARGCAPGRSANVGNPHAQLDEKSLVVLNRQTFVVREQRAETIGVHQEGVHVVRLLADHELAAKLDLHASAFLREFSGRADGLQDI